MNHSTNGQASTASHTGCGRSRSQRSIFSTLLVLMVRCAVDSPAALTAFSVTVHLCRSTPTNVLNPATSCNIQTISVLGARNCELPGGSVPTPPGPYTVLRWSSCLL